MTSSPTDLFRKQALEEYQRKHQKRGDVLRISPHWTGWLYWVLVVLFIGGLIYLVVGRVHEYAEGVAVIRFDGRTEIAAVAGGVISRVEIEPGQKVHADEVLVRFHDEMEQAELVRLNKEFEQQLVASLQNPADYSLRVALANLRSQREYMHSRLDQRVVRAPHAGIVSDVRIRSGLSLMPGDTLLSVTSTETMPTVIAMLPGRYRPQVRPGMSLRLEILGYKYAYQKVLIDSVGDEVIGATELRRVLGAEIADMVQISEPVVIIRGRLDQRTFRADTDTYEYHNGMHARASIRVRSEPIVLALVPGLKYLFEEGHE
ncbi:MAG: hypothetical protein HJJLKODD_01891 [Phycisphaerae bacterium]|nr:hypothetical protein [Phycisphaerae bacterium]